MFCEDKTKQTSNKQLQVPSAGLGRHNLYLGMSASSHGIEVAFTVPLSITVVDTVTSQCLAGSSMTQFCSYKFLDSYEGAGGCAVGASMLRGV